MTSDKSFFFNLNPEQSSLAIQQGLPTRYELVPRPNSDKAEVWYDDKGNDRYSIYKKDVVNQKFSEGIWIKEKEDTHVLIEAEFGDI